MPKGKKKKDKNVVEPVEKEQGIAALLEDEDFKKEMRKNGVKKMKRGNMNLVKEMLDVDRNEVRKQLREEADTLLKIRSNAEDDEDYEDEGYDEEDYEEEDYEEEDYEEEDYEEEGYEEEDYEEEDYDEEDYDEESPTEIVNDIVEDVMKGVVDGGKPETFLMQSNLDALIQNVAKEQEVSDVEKKNEASPEIVNDIVKDVMKDVLDGGKPETFLMQSNLDALIQNVAKEASEEKKAAPTEIVDETVKGVMQNVLDGGKPETFLMQSNLDSLIQNMVNEKEPKELDGVPSNEIVDDIVKGVMKDVLDGGKPQTFLMQSNLDSLIQDMVNASENK
ncbi:MAG: hypothetical protein R3Y53_05840 [Bacillota bacterium]